MSQQAQDLVPNVLEKLISNYFQTFSLPESDDDIRSEVTAAVDCILSTTSINVTLNESITAQCDRLRAELIGLMIEEWRSYAEKLKINIANIE